MNLYALEIPQRTADQMLWLEQHLVGPHLGELAAELAGFQEEAQLAASVDDVLGPRLDDVLSAGLTALSETEFRQLLRSPRALLELQGRIVESGGDYWRSRRGHWPELETLTQRVWGRLDEALDALPPATDAGTTPGSPQLAQRKVQARPERRGGRFGTALLSSLITAAAVLAAVFAWEQRRPEPAPAVATGWGWNKADALPEQAAPDEYLRQLASSAEEWFKVRPETPQELATRLSQLRSGCSTLILSPHRPLSAEDRTWLVERCQAWAANLDQHLVALEAGAPVVEVRAAADETVQRLAAALRDRAEQVAG